MPRSNRRLLEYVSLVGGAGALLACHDLSGLAGTQQLPAGTPDPSVFHNPAGALALYQAALVAFQGSSGAQSASIGSEDPRISEGAFVEFVSESGLLTDELIDRSVGAAVTGNGSAGVTLGNELDARQTDGTDVASSYNGLQGLRNSATIGLGALAAYDPGASTALRGHLYALRGFADLFLADLFCSGVPLSTLNFAGNTSYTYAASSTTDQVYQAAIAQFDSAIALSGDSARILNLARVGQGRAWLARDSLFQAARAVANVPTSFSYTLLVDWREQAGDHSGCGWLLSCWSVSDREGFSGLPYRSQNDPRIAPQVAAVSNGDSIYAPIKYGGATPGVFPVMVASGIEARLIEAEYQLSSAAGSGQWLGTLNALRDDPANVLTVTNGQSPANTAMSQLTDPGLGLAAADADTARLNLLFRERAYWLFLTGHRQGDLRRLIRQYGYQPSQVYPVGPYPSSTFLLYGSAVTVPIPQAEFVNPNFHGCLSQGA